MKKTLNSQGGPACRQAGQTLLIVVLVMIVSLTIGLSVASRSITNLRTTTEEENSQRAFSAAEAGIERVIKTRTNIANVSLGNESYVTASTVDVSGTSLLLNGGSPIYRDDGADLWLSHYPDYATPWNGTLTVYWGDTGDLCNDPALEIIVISGSVASPTSTRYTSDSCESRRSSNKFDPNNGSGGLVAGKNFYYKTTSISISAGLIARIIPLYASTTIGVSGSAAFPSQGRVIQSTGTSGTTARKVTFYEGYPSLPSEFFQYALFSPQ